ncbi:unnamed protein product, partial [Rotaria sordida]
MIMVAWGIVMTLMGLVNSFEGLLVCRLFLGAAEAGLFPGVSYYLSSWYKRRELSWRISIFFSAAALAGAFGGVLAYGITKMAGVGGQEDSLELAHLHFIPKPHKPDTPLRPIAAAIHAPSTEISKFLNDLLAPIFLRVARQTTFINERNLRNNKIGTLRIDDIMRMARLVLDTNIFVYEKTHYRQIRGGAMGSAFTQTLANIYMLDWEQQLIHDQQVDQKIYGRYIDDVFMTTNLTHDQLKAKLENAHRKDPNIRISYSIQSTIDFVDVTVSNEGDHLKTSIFHKSAAEPYVLPYTSDHPRHVFQDFDMERIHIDLSFLLNEYPPSFISKHFHRFFEINQAMSVFERLDSQ